jgi:Ala-tRNA(Pro) deacylase
MPATPDQLFAFFDQLGIAYTTIEHPPLFTVDDGREHWHRIPGMHCKNLFLKDKKDKIWLVVMPGDKRADLKQLGKQLGCRTLSFGKPELLLEIMGLTPGSVTIFGLINDTLKRITLVLDSEVAGSEMVNFHPLHNAASTAIRTEDLMKFIKALGYEPLVTDNGKQAA